MKRPLLLDLFSGAGGAAKGYQRAGFYVVGIDNRPQPRYCGDEFVQADALEYCAEHGREFDVIHASPPCQRFTRAQKIRSRDHPDLITPTRELLRTMGKPFVIENVPGAPLHDPTILRGMMFGLMVERIRLFETTFPVPFVLSPTRSGKFAKMGRVAKPGEYIHVAGKGGARGTASQWAEAMGIDWMSVAELAQAIPPAYTEYIGRQLIEVLRCD
jgi:DNA (cytosine-5)-methyltransferase 1